MDEEMKRSMPRLPFHPTLGQFGWACWWLCAVVAFSILICHTASGDIFLVNENGSATWVEVKIPAGRIVELPGRTIVRLAGDTPDDPDDPPTDNNVDKVAQVSTRYLRNRNEAIAMRTIVGLFNRNDTDFSKVRDGLASAINTVADRSFEGNKFKDWFASVDALLDGANYTRAFIREIDQGIAKAFPQSVNVQSVLDLWSLSRGAATTQRKINAAVEEVIPEATFQAQFNFAEFLRLILEIIQILRDLGIFGALEDSGTEQIAKTSEQAGVAIVTRSKPQ